MPRVSRALFHLLTLMPQLDATLLITRRSARTRCNVSPPDMTSRLRALPAIDLSPPDDGLLRAVLVKQFTDRQLTVDENLIGYLATRIERSFAGARAAVEELDREALRQKRPVTRALAAELLSQA